MSLVTIDLPFDNIVNVVKSLSFPEKKKLYEILDDEILFANDPDLKNRINDITANPHNFVSADEIFSNL